MDARGYDSGPDAGNFDRIAEYALSSLGDENSEQLPRGEPTCCEGGNFGEKHDCRKSNPTMELERENASLRDDKDYCSQACRNGCKEPYLKITRKALRGEEK